MTFNFIFYFRSVLRSIKNIRRLKKNNFIIQFIFEGRLDIKLPVIGYIDSLTSAGRDFAKKCVDYSRRPKAEALLRKTVYKLIKSGYINPDKSIIDIGSWIADNTIVWAKLLRKGSVFAIDPSQDNLNFGMEVAKINNLDNVKWIKAVCSDKPNIPLEIQEGNIEHAVFGKSNDSKSQKFLSTTLDDVIPSNSHDKISLLHVDVEGFEEKVIFGASSIIGKSKPVLIFEQHISNENPSKIIAFLQSHDYEVFMINEVLPKCEYDCRNFIAFSKSKPLPLFPKPLLYKGRSEGIWYAAVGEWLIKV
jgi:FkbM family methyltransferase